jgi:hypothetical protein
MKRMFATVVVVFAIAGCATGQGVATGTPAKASPASIPTSSPPGPSPTAVPSLSASPLPLPIGSLAPGTTYWISDRCCVGPAGIYLSAPAGWETFDPIYIGKNVLGDPALYDILLGTSLAGNVYTGGCQWHGTALDPPVGPTVDDLATALAAHGGPGTVGPTDVTIGGDPGKKVELSIPASVDVATCDRQDGYPVFGRWSLPDAPSVAAPVTYGNSQRNTVYIIDVDGTRQVIYTMYLPGTSAANLAELEQILASIRFEP